MPKVSEKKKRQTETKKNAADKKTINTKQPSTPSPTTTAQNETELMKTKEVKSVENIYEGKDVLPQKSLDTYQNCLELMQPLKDYINRTGNKEAYLRLREVEKVIKYVIKNEKRSRKSQ